MERKELGNREKNAHMSNDPGHPEVLLNSGAVLRQDSGIKVCTIKAGFRETLIASGKFQML